MELYFEMVYKKKLESYERGFEKDALELRFLPYFSLSFDDVHALRFVCLCLFIFNRKCSSAILQFPHMVRYKCLHEVGSN